MRAILIVVALTTVVNAADIPAGRDPARGAWFKSLKMNQSGNSCCDLSDCQQTLAKQEPDGSWSAIVNGKWRTIPPSVVLTKPLSIDGEAYVCNGKDSVGGPGYSPTSIAGTIYCFVPPVPGF